MMWRRGGGAHKRKNFTFVLDYDIEYNMQFVTICNRLDTYRFCYFYYLLLFVLCGDVTEPEQSENIYMT